MTGKPFLLGLTGSIGMGKSTTAAMFAEAGLPVWDADAAVHRLYDQGGAAVEPVKNLHAPAIVEGKVSRDALKSWIAADKTALQKIEALVHPLVAKDRAEFIAAQKPDTIVVLDIPLLFETGSADKMDAIVVVSAPEEIQRARVLERGTMTEAQFETILAKQTPDTEKRARADYVIETTTLEHARAAVQSVIEDVKRKMADA